jgi:hypothetical protein
LTVAEHALTDLLEGFREDLPEYAQTCLRIRKKDATFAYLEFNQAQKIVHQKISEQRQRENRVRCIVLKARQEGVSTYVAARFMRRLHLWAGTTAVVVADTLERAGVLYDIYNRYFEALPREIAPARKSVAQRRRLAFDHESELSVRPATDTEAGRAMTIQLLHASELAFWGGSATETWISLMQAVPHDGSEIIIESTAKGAGGFFHDMWEQAENGDSGWLAIFLPWWIHEEYELTCSEELREIIDEHSDDFEKQALGDGIYYEGELHQLSYDKLAWRRTVIVERFGGDRVRLGRDAVRAFQQEYPATAEEAFLVSGACFFDEDTLRLMTRTGGEAKQRGRLSLDPDGKMVRLTPLDRGSVRIYEPPDPQGHYVIGADTAEGKLVATRRGETDERGGRDYSSAVVYEVDKHRVVAELHGRIAPEVFADQLRLLGHFYACGGGETGLARQVALVGVERSHSSGQTVLRLLREHHRYPRLYWRREINKLTRKISRVLGWVTSVETRMPMLDEVARLIRQSELEVPSKDIVREMVTFVVWEDGKPQAEEGCHDDRVIALAIAVQMAREHRHATSTLVPSWEPSDTPTGY